MKKRGESEVEEKRESEVKERVKSKVEGKKESKVREKRKVRKGKEKKIKKIRKKVKGKVEVKKEIKVREKRKVRKGKEKKIKKVRKRVKSKVRKRVRKIRERIKSKVRKRVRKIRERIKRKIKKTERQIREKRKVKKKRKIKKGKGENIKILEQYDLNVDNTLVKVRIESTAEGILYNLYVPKIGIGTAALLDEVKKELISVSSISLGEMADIKAITKIKKEFMIQASELIREKVPSISLETEKLLIGFLMQEMLGLGELEFLINDSNLEEIVIINSKEPVRIYHKKYGWLKTNIKITKEDDINNYANIIARRVGRQINILTPLLDAHVVTGDRANAVLFPIATKGNTITIRKFARDPWTIIDLINNKTVNLEIASLLWLAVEYEMNVLVSGGTASGKTVFLNVLMPFVPPNHRIISIEDTRELLLPEFLYWCPLVTRTPNPEGKGEVSMLDLLVNSLRMRPDRIVLGEMRRQKEAEVLFEAMHTGHSVYATVHADTAAETITRLTNPPINVPPNLLKAVNLNVVMFRDRKKGIRRVYQVAEYISEKDKVSPNILYRWLAEKDIIIKHNESLVFFEEFARHTAMSQSEINRDMDKRKEILSWMIKNNLRSFEQMGKIMDLYYTNPKLLSELMKKNRTSF